MLARFSTAGRRPTARRRGVTAVESALVLSSFLLLLFGMFEYCRFLMVLHVTNNAARDGVRYASVNVDKPSTFPTTDYTDAGGRVYPSITLYTTRRMASIQKNLEGYSVAVFAVDPAGMALNPVVVRPKTKSIAVPPRYPDPFDAADADAQPWNLAPFPDRLALTIKGTYKPLLPTFLLMPEEIKLNVTAISGGEG